MKWSKNQQSKVKEIVDLLDLVNLLIWEMKQKEHTEAEKTVKVLREEIEKRGLTLVI